MKVRGEYFMVGGHHHIGYMACYYRQTLTLGRVKVL